MRLLAQAGLLPVDRPECCPREVKVDQNSSVVHLLVQMPVIQVRALVVPCWHLLGYGSHGFGIVDRVLDEPRPIFRMSQAGGAAQFRVLWTRFAKQLNQFGSVF